MQFGLFNAPFHPVGQNPTLALERDIQLVEHLDMLGFDEAWFGEHHSGGVEIFGSPELMIATAAARTRRIRLGTGVNSLAYHHPFILADRWVQLDHLTRGRAMFGAGPGALPSDAYQMGIEVSEQRRMMEESLEAIVALLEGDAPVTCKTDWFELREARLHLRPYTWPMPDVRVAAIVSPAGPRAAGRFGLGLLSMGATGHDGFNALADAWGIVTERATEFGHAPDRRRWSLVGPMHLAPTEEQARKDVEYGLLEWYRYFITASPHPLPPVSTVEEAADTMVSTGMAVIGTPQQAIDQIERLIRQSGGFGTYLIMGNEWADWPATLRSLELFARFVMPHFQGQLGVRRDAFAWLEERSSRFRDQFSSAQQKATDAHRAEKEHRATQAVGGGQA